MEQLPRVVGAACWPGHSLLDQATLRLVRCQTHESLQVEDVPVGMRSLTTYRTTLGHKANNAFFDWINSEYEVERMFNPPLCNTLLYRW